MEHVRTWSTYEASKLRNVDFVVERRDSTAVGAPTTRRCAAGHPLKPFVTETYGHCCTQCNETYSMGTTLYSCRECGYDACVGCLRADEQEHGTAVTDGGGAAAWTAGTGSEARGGGGAHQTIPLPSARCASACTPHLLMIPRRRHRLRRSHCAPAASPHPCMYVGRRPTCVRCTQ